MSCAQNGRRFAERKFIESVAEDSNNCEKSVDSSNFWFCHFLDNLTDWPRVHVLFQRSSFRGVRTVDSTFFTFLNKARHDANAYTARRIKALLLNHPGTKNYMRYQPLCGLGNAVGPLCVCVCTITVERNDLDLDSWHNGSSLSYQGQVRRTRSWVKVQGQENVHFFCWKLNSETDQIRSGNVEQKQIWIGNCK